MYRVLAQVAAVLILAAFHSSLAFAQVCDLIGQPVTLTAAGTPTPSSGTVQAGSVEFAEVPNDVRFSVDVEGSTIRMFNNTAAQTIMFNSGAAPYTIAFSQLTGSIIGVSVAVNGVTGLAANAVSFTANSVTIAPANSVWDGGDDVVVTLQLACPTCASLIGRQATLDVSSPVLPGSATATVAAGSAEFNPAPGDQRFSVDVEGSTIRMFNNTASTTVLFNNATTYTVSLGAVPFSIIGLTVAINGVTGFVPANVSFTSNSVTFTVTNSVWHGGDSVTVALQLACDLCTSLVGQQATLDVASPVLPGSASATVTAGSAEFNPAPGDQRFSVDVESSTIRMFNNTASTNVLFNNATTYTVSFPAASFAINGVSVVINGVSGFVPANVSFTSNSVTFTVTGSVWHGGDSVIVALQTLCQPTIAKAFGAPSILVNGSTSLTITITNPNADAALTNVAFTDTLPAGLIVASTPNLNSTCGSVTAVAGSASVSLSGGTVAASGSCTVSVDVTATTAGTKINTIAAVTSAEINGGGSNSATLLVTAAPTISKAFGAPSVPVNGSTSLSFTVTNPNPIDLTGVAFSDALPAGLIVSTPSGVTGSCGAGTITATSGSSTISLAGGTIAASGSCTFSVNVTGLTAGTFNNTTSAVTSTNGGTGGTSNTATLNVVSAPVISKSFGDPEIAFGGTTSLSFTIINPAENTVPLTDVGFTDTFSGVTIVVASPNGLTGSCGGGTITAVPGSSSVTLAGATLPVGGSCTFSIDVTSVAAGTVNNTVTVTSANGGTGNTSTSTLSVAARIIPTLHGWMLVLLALMLAGAGWVAVRRQAHAR